MIKEAEASGKLKKGGTVVEGTSGSTGICLASLCRAKGYGCVIVMPDDQVRGSTSQAVGRLTLFVRAESGNVCSVTNLSNPKHMLRGSAIR